MRPRSSQAGSPNLVAVTLIEHFVSSTLIENSMIFEMSADPRLIAGSPDSERMDGHHEKKLMTKKHNTYLIVLIQNRCVTTFPNCPAKTRITIHKSETVLPSPGGEMESKQPEKTSAVTVCEYCGHVRCENCRQDRWRT